MIRSIRHILVALLAMGALGSTAGIAPAATKDTAPACWKVLINDWYDGRIDGIYPIHCYRDALKHLPSDVDTYSSARDDIQQALQKRITQSRGGNGSTTTTPGGGTSGGGGSGGGTSGSGGGSGGGGSQAAGGPIGGAINAGKPGSADSLPVPLLVLGGVALALMAAGGAGFLARRSRLRRMQVASAAVPHGSANERPEQP
ncbi:MAG: hypothetical protein ACM3QU_15005 [Verrucomicrobiota bacterium]